MSGNGRHIYLQCPQCGAKGARDGFRPRGQFCDCGWARNRAPKGSRMDLFGDALPVSETVAHGHRTTPAHVVRTLWAQPEFQTRRGVTVDLGSGAGSIAEALAQADADAGLGSAHECIRVDVRGMPPCTFPAARIHFDASQPWPTPPGPPAGPEWPTWGAVAQVVSNPPWSIQRCPVCEATWEASRRRHCVACTTSAARVDGEDLAQAMVAQAMIACPAADVWVIHTTDWRFHTARARFFLPSSHPECTRPASHALATVIDIAARVAWGDPSARGKVAQHNKMTSFYHFAPVPAARADWHTRYRLLPTWEQHT